MKELQTLAEKAKVALLERAGGVFGKRVYDGRLRPFEDKGSERILPAAIVFTPQITFASDRPTERGRFAIATEYLMLEVWSRVDPKPYQDKSQDLYEEAQTKALRMTVDAAVSAIMGSNDVLSMTGEIPRLDVKFGSDISTQSRADAAIVMFTFTNKGVFSVCPNYDAVPLKSLFLGYDIATDPNVADAVNARWLELDKDT